MKEYITKKEFKKFTDNDFAHVKQDVTIIKAKQGLLIKLVLTMFGTVLTGITINLFQ